MLQKYIAMLCWLLLVAGILHAQNTFHRIPFDNIWLFNHARMDFSYEPPLLLSDDQPMRFDGTNLSIGDSLGSLKYYSNGIYVSNSIQQEIVSNNDLNPGEYAANRLNIGFVYPQMGIWLPVHNEATRQLKFYLFHQNVTELDQPNEFGDRFINYNLSVTEILETNGPQIVRKNDTLLVDTLSLGQISATKAANGRDWWLLVPQEYTHSFHSYYVTYDSVSYRGITPLDSTFFRSGVGQAYFSPKGNKYAKIDMITLDTDRLIRIFDFDRCTGALSNPVTIRYNDEAIFGGLAFSENGRYLYVSSMIYIYQYDLTAEDVESSRFTIATAPGSWGYYLAGLAPDGKIYISTQGWYPALHVINQPNRKGETVDFEHLGLPLPVETSRGTMPNFPYYGLGPLDGSPQGCRI